MSQQEVTKKYEGALERIRDLEYKWGNTLKELEDQKTAHQETQEKLELCRENYQKCDAAREETERKLKECREWHEVQRKNLLEQLNDARNVAAAELTSTSQQLTQLQAKNELLQAQSDTLADIIKTDEQRITRKDERISELVAALRALIRTCPMLPSESQYDVIMSAEKLLS